MALPDIDLARCTACGRCVAACDPHVLSLESRGWVKSSTLHDPLHCTGCGACADACPFNVITMRTSSVEVTGFGLAPEGRHQEPGVPLSFPTPAT